MKHAIVYDPPMVGGAKAILGALLKLAGLALLLTVLLAFPALSQRLVPVRMPLLLESDPVAIMGLETARAHRDSVSRSDAVGATIHFDVGSSRVRADASITLGETVELLRSRPAVRIRIEGKGDVRGSAASDITLAWDRAGAAKVWLINHGMDSDRIDAVGYSEARCEKLNAVCSWPIRDEFLIVAGANAVVRASP